MQEPDDDFLLDLATLMNGDESLSKEGDLLKPVGKSIVGKVEDHAECSSRATQDKLHKTDARSQSKEEQLSQDSRENGSNLAKIEAQGLDKQAPQSFEHHMMASTRDLRISSLAERNCDDFIFGKKSQREPQPMNDVGNLEGSQNSKKRKWTDESMAPVHKRASNGQTVTTEKYTRLRLTNALLSSAVMDQRMEGRRFLYLHQIRDKMVNGDISGDWVTGGVIVEKMPVRSSKKGESFSTWKLSSLQLGFENKIVSLFLFGTCHTEHWKVQEGMCIALLNPNILPPKEGNTRHGSALTIAHSQQLMELGTSKDFGRCQGMVKKKETRCKFVVNRSFGDYCEYHIQTEYKKTRANRMEFQFGYGAPKHNPHKGKMMQKLKKSIDGGEYYYGGEVVTLGPPKEKTRVTLKSIMGHTLQAQAKKQLRESAAALRDKNEANAREADESSEGFKQLLQFPTAGTRNMMKHLQKEDEEEEKAKKPVKFVSITPSELLRREKTNMAKLREKAHMARLQGKSQGGSKSKNMTSGVPLLARGCAPNEDIEFADCGDIISNSLGKKLDPVGFYPKARLENTLTVKNARPDYSKEQAKSRAVQLWKERNVCDERTESGVKKRSSEQAKEILRKVAENRSQDADTGRDSQGKAIRKSSVLSTVFGSLDLSSEEGRKILEAKSSHSDLVKEDELKRSGLYFKALEKREMYETKIQSITELKVTAYCCKQCKYLAESASKYCEEEKHRVIKVEAKKRFFICKKCKNRTYALNDRIPDHPCRNCGEMKYERTSMHKEKEGPKQEREKLLLRGEEHPRFLNSIK